MDQFLAVKHNIEVAHRLYLTEGKCENIHGHSMWITCFLRGEVNDEGLMAGLDFTDIKHVFREHLDNVLDHHLLLNENDPLAGRLMVMQRDAGGQFIESSEAAYLPGLMPTVGDPTTENIAMWIGMYMSSQFAEVFAVEVWETSVNMARWEV
jgi:6-pyruvoyl-tetrahydropterin synthase